MIRRYYKLYIQFLKQYLKTLMEYKTDFFTGVLGFFAVEITGIAFLFIIFEKIPSLNGWTFNQVLFIYAFAQIPRGLDHLFTDNLWMLSGKIIVKGEFDRYLLRPINPLFHLLSEIFQPDAIGELLVGIILLVISITNLGITITLLDSIIFILLILCGTIIYTSVKLFFSSLAFLLIFTQSILFMAYSINDFAKYPITIYSKPVRIILTFIIPFGFTAFFPASFFINKTNAMISLGCTFLAAIISFSIAYYTWNRGIQAYESAGN